MNEGPSASRGVMTSSSTSSGTTTPPWELRLSASLAFEIIGCTFGVVPAPYEVKRRVDRPPESAAVRVVSTALELASPAEEGETLREEDADGEGRGGGK